MVQILPKEHDWSDAFQSIGQGLSQGYQNRADEMALQKAVMDLGDNPPADKLMRAILSTKTYGNEAKQNLFKNELGIAQFQEMQKKNAEATNIANEKNRIAALKKDTKISEAEEYESLIADGMPDYEADLYVKSPPGVKGRIIASHNEAKARGLREPLSKKAQKPLEGELKKPVEGNLPQEEVIAPEDQETQIDPLVKKEPVAIEKKPEWPVIPPPPETTASEREKFRSKNQTENNKILKETKGKLKTHENALIRYNTIDQLNNTHKLPDGVARLLVNPQTGEVHPEAQLFGLVNKETQQFAKTIRDFLVDAKNYFGARVTNFDVGAFNARLPGLLNTEDGRRLIVQQMKLMEELEIVREKELDQALKHYGRNATYSDIQKVVDEKIIDKEAKLIEKVNNVNKASDYLDLMVKNPKYKDSILMQSPEGKFKAVPKDKLIDANARGYTKW